jgi:hypothetical protein
MKDVDADLISNKWMTLSMQLQELELKRIMDQEEMR